MHQKMWKVFLQTGNVEAYLLLKKMEASYVNRPYEPNISKHIVSLKPEVNKQA
ncbi:YqzL family protein [Pseudogracilibacillus sp. SO10305]